MLFGMESVYKYNERRWVQDSNALTTIYIVYIDYFVASWENRVLGGGRCSAFGSRRELALLSRLL